MTQYLIFSVCLALLTIHEANGIAVWRVAAAKNRTGFVLVEESGNRAPAFKWNTVETGLPLLGLAPGPLRPGIDQSLTYRADQINFPIFKSLAFAQGKYMMPAISEQNQDLVFVEFTLTDAPHTYAAGEGLKLVDKGNLKIVQTAGGVRFLFVQYPDGEFRCATINQNQSATLNLLYTANGLVLRSVVDATGRSLTFNYGMRGIQSLTQTWMSNLEGFTRTWVVGEETTANTQLYAHAVTTRSGKILPANALINEYTEAMKASDQLLAQIFGGPNAVAGGNGFEPAGLAASYPLYRGDVVGDDGIVRLGHLSHAIHLYGSSDGRGDSPLYIPTGFTAHSSAPSTTVAAMTFYYPRLGRLADITLAVFHVAEFQMVQEGDRIRIGSIGGPGGSSPLYKHSHIEFYRGNVGLPPAADRASLRIDPSTVFSK